MSVREVYEATIANDRYTATLESGEYNSSIYGEGDTYGGRYRVTPSQQVQVLLTNGLMMVDNVTINAIPNNYGLVERVGMSLHIS